MIALTGKYPHTHFHAGKRIKITLRDGTEIVDKFVETRSRYLVTENHRIRTSELKAVTYAKGMTGYSMKEVETVGCGHCWKCLEADPKPFYGMVLCQDCGNKRCPKATDCALECSGSNEPGQKGSVYE